MYSLNVPLPSAVARRAREVARSLSSANPRERDEHTLVVKRLGSGDAAAYHAIEARVREALAGTAPFRVRIDHVDQFETAATGPSPVVYLAVESSGLRALHDDLCGPFDPVEGVEGPDYVPHVTVARGGDPARAEAVCGAIEPIEWTVESLHCYDAERGERVSRVALPA